jgi:phosphoribosylglycinamide formyltransferase
MPLPLLASSLSSPCAFQSPCQSPRHSRIDPRNPSRKTAYGLERASTAGIKTTYHNLVAYKKEHPSTPEGVEAARKEYDADLAKIVLGLQPRPDLIVCAGWMHIFTPSFLSPIASASPSPPFTTPGIRVINLHPALPGEFAGASAIERAYEAGQKGEIKRTGVMIHELIEEVDAGEAILTQEVEIREGESLDDLEGRMHDVEHGLIVEGTRKVLEGLAR